MSTYPPGRYTVEVDVEMDADIAREMGAPELATYTGNRARRSFAPYFHTSEPKTTEALRDLAVSCIEGPLGRYKVVRVTVTASR
ncbi:hypothetical protein [Streptomyces sp. NPDC059916]|uniref:hypothetical protein n=1 Tax=Streptomyces sp. NPDC059916 TaxID=3347001 RepID=UPI00369A6040